MTGDTTKLSQQYIVSIGAADRLKRRQPPECGACRLNAAPAA
jgi:hypothetical protein